MTSRVWSAWVSAAATVALLLAGDGTAPFEKYTGAERRHWAFQPRSNPDVPKFSAANERAWTRTPIDAFVLAKLKQSGLSPAPSASRATLIRRVYFDLIGLPPTPAEVDAFVRDKSEGAWARIVDRLLARPEYGERWAQHWLDVVRFAESDGFEYDTHRRDAWRYRDYVIRSLNADKPYDQFVREQLAGDEIDASNQELLIASGFQRLGPVRKNAGNQEVASSRNEVLTEMTNVVGSALLGVTLGCARCHDHKFDPIRHTDYYRMQAYFASTFDKEIPLASEDEQTAWKAKAKVVEDELKGLKAKMKGLEGSARTEMEKKVKEVEARAPDPLPAIHSISIDTAKPTPIHVLARGDHQNKGDRVGVRPLGILVPDDAPELPLTTAKPRSALADWTLDPNHPLTARVMVNRIWHFHFGRGIVSTPNDFGRMGTRPSHPELLDYLANEFVRGGWRMKPLHRAILLSSTYQQSSRSPIEAKAMEADADNKLLWKFSRRRLTAEEIRDAMLAVSGRLNSKSGGPSVIIPVEQGLVNLLYKPSQWAVTSDPAEHDRRSVYLLYKRNLRLPFMEVFDAPDMQLSCARRESSTHAPQALELLNGDFANDMAASFAARLDREAGGSVGRQAELAYRLAAGRAPSPAEKQLAVEFLKVGPLREFALATLNLNSFLYVD